MKLLKRLLLLLIISAAVYAGYYIKQQGSGFVLIQYQDFSIETSVFVFSGLIFLLFIFLYALLRFVFNLVKIPDFISHSYKNYQDKKSSSGLINGLTLFTEGHFKKAENIFIKQASVNQNSFLNYLLAARAAQLLHADDRRDHYLNLAHQINPDAGTAIGLTQAELQLSHQQNELALATLNQLFASQPKHDYVLRLLSRAYLQLGDWENLCPLLKELRQTKSLPEEVLQKSEKTAYRGYLAQTSQQGDAGKLGSIWDGMPKYLKTDAEMIALYANLLIDNDQLHLTEELLRNKLNKNWDDGLITIYAGFVNKLQAHDSDTYFNSLLDNCEKWLKITPHQAMILLTAGKLCTQLKLWGKARSYFDASLSIQPQADTYLQMAQLLEQTNDIDLAQKHYKLGLSFCLDSKRKLS